MRATCLYKPSALTSLFRTNIMDTSGRGNDSGRATVLCDRCQRVVNSAPAQAHRDGTREGATNDVDAQPGWLEKESGSRQSWHRDDLHVVLVHPQIPQNTGNVARTCAATGTALHLVAPLGFEIDDKQLKRAGLDYWPFVAVKVHESWEAFEKYFADQDGPKRLVAFTKFGRTPHCAPAFSYEKGDWLIFGSETSGLPDAAHEYVTATGGAMVRIPMVEAFVRSINLSASVGIGLYEAIRQRDESEGRISDAYELTDALGGAIPTLAHGSKKEAE